MCRKNHTAVFTWTNPGDNVTKTVTGCTSGKPVFIIRKTNKDMNTNDGKWCAVKIESGALHATTTGDAYYLATHNGGVQGSSNVLVVIPNASNVVLRFYSASDDDTFYIYM